MKTVRKLFWAWDFDREEDWLNDMAAQGWGLVDVGFCRYTFEPCRPGEYGCRLELLADPLGDPKSQEYLEFLAEAGVEYVGHLFRWVYLRKRTDDGPFELFSDTDSRIRHLRRIGIFARDIRSERSIRYPGNFHRYARRLACHGYSVNGKPLIVKAAGKLIAADVRFKHRLTVYIGQAVYGLQHTVRTY